MTLIYVMYTIIILCQKYLQIVRFHYVYFGQMNESVCLSPPFMWLVVGLRHSHFTLKTVIKMVKTASLLSTQSLKST